MLTVLLEKSLTVTEKQFVKTDIDYIDFTKRYPHYGTTVDALDGPLPKPEVMAWLEENCRDRYSIKMAKQKSQFEDERLEIVFRDDLEALHFKMMWGSGMDDDNEPVP